MHGECFATIEGFESVRGGLRIIVEFPETGAFRTDMRSTGFVELELLTEQGLMGLSVEITESFISPVDRGFFVLLGGLALFILLEGDSGFSWDFGFDVTVYSLECFLLLFATPGRDSHPSNPGASRFRFLDSGIVAGPFVLSDIRISCAAT